MKFCNIVNIDNDDAKGRRARRAQAAGGPRRPARRRPLHHLSPPCSPRRAIWPGNFGAGIPQTIKTARFLKAIWPTPYPYVSCSMFAKCLSNFIHVHNFGPNSSFFATMLMTISRIFTKCWNFWIELRDTMLNLETSHSLKDRSSEVRGRRIPSKRPQ